MVEWLPQAGLFVVGFNKGIVAEAVRMVTDRSRAPSFTDIMTPAPAGSSLRPGLRPRPRVNRY